MIIQNLFMRYLILTYLFVFTFLLASAQDSNLDSLRTSLLIAQEDSTKVNAMNDLSSAFLTSNLDSAKHYIETAINIAKTGTNPKLYIRSINHSGLYEWHRGNLEVAIDSFRAALALSHQHNSKRQTAVISGNIGMLFTQTGYPDSAVHYLEYSLQLNRERNDSAQITKNLMDLSNHFTGIGKYSKGLEYMQEVRAYYEKKKLHFNLTYIYANLGVIYARLHDFDQAYYYYQQSRASDKLTDETDIESLNLTNLALLFVELTEQYDSAYNYFHKIDSILVLDYDEDLHFSNLVNEGSLDLKRGDGSAAIEKFRNAIELTPFQLSKKYQVAVYINFGEAYLRTNLLDSARININRGLELAKELNSYEHLQKAYYNLFLVDSIENHFANALAAYQLYATYTDSLWNNDSKAKIAELEILYQTEKNRIENIRLKEDTEHKEAIIFKQQIIGGLIMLALLVALVLFIVLIRSTKKIRYSNNLLEEHKKQLIELNITKDKFFSIIAHDLKSPFTSLLGFIEILEMEHQLMSEAQRIEIIQNLEKTATNTYNLLTNLLDWARSQRNQIQYKPEHFNLKEKVTNLTQFLKQRLLIKNLSLTIEIDDKLNLTTDPQLLQAVLMNLTNNAIKFTPDNGFIEITATEKETYLEICVRDNGIGIPKEKANKLFTIDNKYQRQGTNGELGTGLGLILCKEFVDLMNGSITVNSTEGKGSIFCLRLNH